MKKRNNKKGQTRSDKRTQLRQLRIENLMRSRLTPWQDWASHFDLQENADGRVYISPDTDLQVCCFCPGRCFSGTLADLPAQAWNRSKDGRRLYLPFDTKVQLFTFPRN